MDRLKQIALRLLYPPLWVYICLPPIAFGGLIVVFVLGCEQSIIAYVDFALSAYSLTVLVIAAVHGIVRLRRFAKAKIHNAQPNSHVRRYFTDPAVKGSVGLLCGALADIAYAVFRLVTGLMFSSYWFLSLTAYHLFLGLLRIYLFNGYRRCNASQQLGLAYMHGCYNNCGKLLLVVTIPMGGIITLAAMADYSFSYPGYVIYVSALYTFVSATLAVINLVRFAKVGNPILSAGKIVGLVAAEMSIFGLQTAMLTTFSDQNATFELLMNCITGFAVFVFAIGASVYMIVHGRRRKRLEEDNNE